MTRKHHERGHQGATNTWLTPPEIVAALGPFDLDPCAAGNEYAWRPWETAARSYTWGGLERPWEGFVWLNPPYGPHTGSFLAKLAGHPGGGIALTFARTETQYFFESVWPKASGLLFLRGRLSFRTPGGAPGDTATAPSVLMGYGDEALRRLAQSDLVGHLVVSSATVLLTPEGAPVGTWREAVAAALAGRKLRLRELYRAAEGTAKVREAKAAGHNWQAQIRRALQEHFTPHGNAVWSPA